MPNYYFMQMKARSRKRNVLKYGLFPSCITERQNKTYAFKKPCKNNPAPATQINLMILTYTKEDTSQLK